MQNGDAKVCFLCLLMLFIGTCVVFMNISIVIPNAEKMQKRISNVEWKMV